MFFQGKTVIRTGYGIYHEDAQLDDQNIPTANDEGRYELARGAQFPNLTYPFDSLLATATGILSPKDQARQRKDTYVQEWSASIQQALPMKFTGTLSVIGNKGTNIMNRSYINIINPLTGARPYPQYGQIEFPRQGWRQRFQRSPVPGAASPHRWLAVHCQLHVVDMPSTTARSAAASKTCSRKMSPAAAATGPRAIRTPARASPSLRSTNCLSEQGRACFRRELPAASSEDGN